MAKFTHHPLVVLLRGIGRIRPLLGVGNPWPNQEGGVAANEVVEVETVVLENVENVTDADSAAVAKASSPPKAR